MKLEDIKTKTKDAVDYLVQSLESGHSEVLTQYLGTMARFHTYSFGNVMLIARQKPDAINVAGIRTRNSLSRFVNKSNRNGVGVPLERRSKWPASPAQRCNWHNERIPHRNGSQPGGRSV